MAYQVIGIETAFGANETPLGIGFPFTGPAVFKSVYTTSEQTLARMKTLLLTRKGERYQLPTYGTNLLDILFQPNISELKEEIIDIITGPVNYWLPDVNIDLIDIITAEDDPTLDYEIKISITFSVTSLETETITITLDEQNNLQVV
jgi:phage baseplate assembly protein W